MKRILILLLTFVLSLFSVMADSHTLSMSIDNISGGQFGFGLGMLPLGTTYTYSKSFKMLPVTASARWRVQTAFSFGSATVDDNFDYKSGTPRWYYPEKSNSSFNILDPNPEDDKALSYYRPAASADMYLSQGFGINPVEGSGSLITLTGGININYHMALEPLSTSRSGTDFVFVNPDGSAKEPYGGSNIKAHPWLNRNRISLNNFVYLDASLNLKKSTGFNTADGIGFSMRAEWGPWWLLNEILPIGRTSDYYRLSFSFEQRITVFTVNQEDGRNWLSSYVGHSDSISYIDGSVIPMNKITTDRLKGAFTDKIWITIYGPQFLAADCYPYIELALTNNCYFGGIQNEQSRSTELYEWTSRFSVVLHLRLFGFVHVEYTAGYDFMRGMHAEFPSWDQSATINFYVSL